MTRWMAMGLAAAMAVGCSGSNGSDDKDADSATADSAQIGGTDASGTDTAAADTGGTAAGTGDTGDTADTAGADTGAPTGAACAEDAECAGAHPQCLHALYPLAELSDSTGPARDLAGIGLAFPGGYCSATAPCAEDADCGPGGTCFLPLADVSPEAFAQTVAALQLAPEDAAVIAGLADFGQCLQACTTEADCPREGYTCAAPLAEFLALAGAGDVGTFCIAAQGAGDTGDTADTADTGSATEPDTGTDTGTAADTGSATEPDTGTDTFGDTGTADSDSGSDTGSAQPRYCDYVYPLAAGSGSGFYLDARFHNVKSGAGAMNRYFSVGTNAQLNAAASPFDPTAWPRGYLRLRVEVDGNDLPVDGGGAWLIEYFLPMEFSVSQFGVNVTTDVEHSAGLLDGTGALQRTCAPVASGVYEGEVILWDACDVPGYPGGYPYTDSTTPGLSDAQWNWTEAAAQAQPPATAGCVPMRSTGAVTCSGFLCGLVPSDTLGPQQAAWDQVWPSVHLTMATFPPTVTAIEEWIVPDSASDVYTGVVLQQGGGAADAIYVECGAWDALTCDEQPGL